jgi:hypothetical protein
MHGTDAGALTPGEGIYLRVHGLAGIPVAPRKTSPTREAYTIWAVQPCILMDMKESIPIPQPRGIDEPTTPVERPRPSPAPHPLMSDIGACKIAKTTQGKNGQQSKHGLQGNVVLEGGIRAPEAMRTTLRRC